MIQIKINIMATLKSNPIPIDELKRQLKEVLDNNDIIGDIE